MKYNSLEDFVKNHPSKPCAQAKRNYEIFKERERGLTLEQLAIKFQMSRIQIINILLNK
jgi:Mor family transcriptional regulator